MKINYWLLIVVVTLILSLFVIRIGKLNKKIDIRSVIINNQRFQVELALTESQRETGLMNRTHLDANAGMLFVFPTSDIYTFWMKNTLIPLDIIWINDNKIVEMTTLQPQSSSNIPQYTPKNKAYYVLELNAGTISRYNFKLGDIIDLK